MFTRYSISASPEEITQRFSAEVHEGYAPNYNAAPTHLLPVITHDSQKGISFFYWGGPPALANRKALGERLINIKTESIGDKPVIRKKLVERRCLIPADGFYLWKKTGKKTAIPYRFTLPDKSTFGMAGLWEEYDDENGEMFHTFSVITTEANASVKLVEERMPAILSPEQERVWLNASDESSLLSCLKPCASRLEFYSVSPLVNLPDRNSKNVILPAPAADQFGNLSLFD